MIHQHLSTDTIAAVATPPGSGGIAVLKLSGPRALPIALSIFKGKMSPGDAPREMVYGAVCDRGEIIDTALFCYMRAPRSYTGEDVVEIQTHGGKSSSATVLELLLDRGARLSDPGEFTRRAFLNGKIDLVQAEAVHQIVESESREALRSAERLHDGSFSSTIRSIRDRITQCTAFLELRIDFSDQEGHDSSPDEITTLLDNTEASLSALLSTYEQGRRIRSGLRTVIAGPVNTGKSSLFNLLLGRKRAIVHPRPGTTRDWIEERIELDGRLFTLVDTAGMRSTDDEIEREGVRESERLVDDADIVILVNGPDSPAPQLSTNITTRVFSIHGKADLIPTQKRLPELFYFSAQSGEGLDQLRLRLTRIAEDLTKGTPECGIILLERHRILLSSALNSVRSARSSLSDWSEEVSSFELKTASDALDSLLGINTSPDILDTIFRSFCIGK